MSQQSQSPKKQKPVGSKDLASFCRQMSMISRSDITLLEGVSLMAKQTSNPRIKDALGRIHAKMEGGLPFGKAFVAYGEIFPAYLNNMVELGEESGTLDDSFAEMADFYEKDSRFQAKIRSATVYPGILLILMILVIALLVTKVLPTFESLLLSMGGELPAITKGLLSFGTGLSKIIIPLLIAIIIIIAIVYAYFKSNAQGRLRWDKFKLSFPGLAHLNQCIVTTRFARSMAIMIKSGAPLLTSIQTAAGLLDNTYAESKIKNQLDKFGEYGGPDLSAIMEKTGIFPLLFVKMIVIGEKTGNLDLMMEKSAQSFSLEMDDALEKLSNTLEPTLIIILSVIVAIILLSIMLPMINIISAIG